MANNQTSERQKLIDTYQKYVDTVGLNPLKAKPVASAYNKNISQELQADSENPGIWKNIKGIAKNIYASAKDKVVNYFASGKASKTAVNYLKQKLKEPITPIISPVNWLTEKQKQEGGKVLAKEVIKFPGYASRQIVSGFLTGLEITEKITPSRKEFKNETYQPTGKIEKLLLGEEPIISFQKRYEGATNLALSLGFSPKTAPIVAMAGVAAGTAIDLSGFTPSKTGYKLVEKEILKAIEKQTGKKIEKELAGKIGTELKLLTRDLKSKDEVMKVSDYLVGKYSQGNPLRKPNQVADDLAKIESQMRKKIESYRKEADLVVNSELKSIAGVRKYKTGSGEFSSQSLKNIKSDMKTMSDNLKAKAHDDLLQFDEEYKALAKQKSELNIELEKVNNTLDDIDFSFTDDLAKTDEFSKVKVEEARRAVNLNIDKLETSESVRELAQDIGKLYFKPIQAQKRGTVSWKNTNKLAQELGMSEEELLKTEIGRTFNASQIQAARQIHQKALENARNLSNIAMQNNSDEAIALARQAIERASMIQKSLSGLEAEAGRALNILKSKTWETKAWDKALAEIGGRDVSEEVIKRFASISKNDKQAMLKFLANVNKATTADKVYELWLNSILSGITTHKYNVIGNFLFTGAAPVERTVRAIIDVPASILTGKRDVFFGEIPAQLFGMGAGVIEGVKKGLYAMIHGVPAEAITKMDIKYLPAIKGIKGELARIPTKLLTAEDEFFKAIAGTGEKYALAYRQAVKEKLTGKGLTKRIAELVNEPTEEIIKKVEAEKLYRTFQNELGKSAKAFMNWRDKNPGLRYIVPFIKTPVNIGKAGLSRTPLNIFNIISKSVKKAKGLREYGREEITKDIANLTIGSLIAGAVAYEVSQGNITGKAPIGKEERDKFYRQGKLPYSIKIGDTWYSYERLEPLAQSVGTLADTISYYKEIASDKEITPSEAINSVLMITRNLTSKSFLSGISSLLNAISDPQRYASDYIEFTASGFLPYGGLLSNIAKVGDTALREQKGIMQAFQSKIPGLREKLVPRRNAWGEEIEQPSIVSLLPSEKEKKILLEQELENIGYVMGFPSNSLKIPDQLADSLELPEDKRKIVMTQKEYNTFQKYAGQAAKKALILLINSPKYQSLPDLERKDAVESIVKKTRERARQIFIPVIFNNRLRNNYFSDIDFINYGNKEGKQIPALQGK